LIQIADILTVFGMELKKIPGLKPLSIAHLSPG